MTRNDAISIKHYIEAIRKDLTDFEKYHISQEDAIVRIRVALRYLEKYVDEKVKE